MTNNDFGKSAPEASLHHLAEILRSAVDAVISIDALGRIESINPATERLFGYSARELIGENVKILMPEPDRSQHDGYIRQYRHTGQRKIIGIGREVTGRRRDGSRFPMHLTVSEYEIDGERHFAGVVHDLTAQRQSEAEGSRQQKIFEAIVNDEARAIILDDQHKRIFLANRGVEKILGYSEDELTGRNSRILYATDDDYDLVSHPNAKPGQGHSEAIRVHCVRKNGENFPAEVITSVVRDRDRSILGFMRHIRDVTQQDYQEELLRRSQRMDALGQLTGGIAHDFNNLLSVIIGNLELIDDSADRDTVRELTQRAFEAAKMGARLTGRLLSFSRQRKLEPAIVQLNDQISNMIEILQRSIGETVELITALEDPLWSVRADPSEIENAVLNLVINSRDAMPNGGWAKLETRNICFNEGDDPRQFGIAPGDYVRISVSDNGSGMPPEIVARAFEPFFTTKAAGRGTGLGLASIYGFAKQSGGNATIYSEQGRGTTVNIYLPRYAAAAVSDAPPESAGTIATGAGERILVVEDNPDLRVLTVTRLKRLGYLIEEAENAPSALAKLETLTIDLIFSDVVMPGGLTGYELAARARERFPDIKVLLTSGYGPEQAAEQDTTKSMLKVLRKPYKQADLANAVHEILQGP